MQHIAPVINCLVTVEMYSLILFRVLWIYLSVFKDQRRLKNLFKMSTNYTLCFKKEKKEKVNHFLFQKGEKVWLVEIIIY